MIWYFHTSFILLLQVLCITRFFFESFRSHRLCQRRNAFQREKKNGQTLDQTHLGCSMSSHTPFVQRVTSTERSWLNSSLKACSEARGFPLCTLLLALQRGRKRGSLVPQWTTEIAQTGNYLEGHAGFHRIWELMLSSHWTSLHKSSWMSHVPGSWGSRFCLLEIIHKRRKWQGISHRG